MRDGPPPGPRRSAKPTVCSFGAEGAPGSSEGYRRGGCRDLREGRYRGGRARRSGLRRAVGPTAGRAGVGEEFRWGGVELSVVSAGVDSPSPLFLPQSLVPSRLQATSSAHPGFLLPHVRPCGRPQQSHPSGVLFFLGTGPRMPGTVSDRLQNGRVYTTTPGFAALGLLGLAPLPPGLGFSLPIHTRALSCGFWLNWGNHLSN